LRDKKREVFEIEYKHLNTELNEYKSESNELKLARDKVEELSTQMLADFYDKDSEEYELLRKMRDDLDKRYKNSEKEIQFSQVTEIRKIHDRMNFLNSLISQHSNKELKDVA